MQKMKLKAFAKINLGLDVVRRREDGYHEVRMIMQTVGIYDRITIEISDKPGIRVKTNLSFLPNNENNLVYQAAKLLMDEFNIEKGIVIDLEKHIPVAAGMAGGSTDAAAVLVGVNKLFRLKLSQEQLMIRGVKIGADVPYCIMRGTALSEGIGEILTPLPAVVPCHVLVAKPAISVSTKFVYENLHADTIEEHPDIDGMIKEIKAANLQGIVDKMGNVLETVTISRYPVIEELKKLMKENGALGAMMSGSGPTVFGIFDKEETAVKAYNAVKASKLGKQLYLTNMVNRPNRRKIQG